MGPKEMKLPPKTSRRLQGKRIAVIETKEGIPLKPVEDTIDKGMGMLKGRGVSTARFFALKREEKESAR